METSSHTASTPSSDEHWARDWFVQASAAFRDTVALCDHGSLDRPGLGQWSIRTLLGHTCRAFVTIDNYLGAAPEAAEVTVHSAADYFRTARAALADPAQVSARAVAAGHELGDDPLGAANALAMSVTALVEQANMRELVATPVGVMTLGNYLPTRAFELTVHSIDIIRAQHQPIPGSLAAALTPAVRLSTELAEPGQHLAVLLALTGREALPENFSVI